MDTFMDKLAQKLNAQEMIKANSAADAEEMDQLKNQLREYDECLAQMQQANKELRAVNHAMETLMSETIAPEVTKLSEESVAAIRKMQQENTEKLQELQSMLRGDAKAGRSVGVWNVYRRLALYYGDNFQFDIESTPGQGTTCIVSLPVNKEEVLPCIPS